MERTAARLRLKSPVLAKASNMESIACFQSKTRKCNGLSVRIDHSIARLKINSGCRDPFAALNPNWLGLVWSNGLASVFWIIAAQT